MSENDLKQARHQAQCVFDKLWSSGKMTRQNAYRWLAGEMKLAQPEISQMDAQQCAKLIKLVNYRLRIMAK